MTEAGDARLYRASLIRFVEEELLRLFSAGKIAGTTHTCIGQELAAVALSEALDRERDVVFSNHRCHGHYLAWTDDVDGLIAEVMGRESGVCAGLGGSQHLCGRGFFSNGVQGGIMPVSAGLALAEKLAARDGIVAVCIGDGTLGEGVVYETFNIASKWRLPLLIVLENNRYAQSTSQAETLAGDICARAAAFGIATAHADTWDHDTLLRELEAAADRVRSACRPMFVRVDTYRLAAHSKGDDDRDRAEIEAYEARDPVSRFLEQARGSAAARTLESIRRRVDDAVARASAAQSPSLRARAARVLDGATQDSGAAPTTQLEAINRALRAWLASDPSLMILGEDIRSPYGGAFKVTRGLSEEFPDRVLNTPISEAAIVGIGSGLGLGGRRAVVEIMFGDFLGLCFDQVLNHAAKFCGMYNGRVENPLVIRTPMGGGRGYGPTHSQNIEKHFVGIPGLTVIVMHARTRVAELYAGLRRMREPVLVIENKLLYRESCAAPLPPGYSMRHVGGAFGPTLLTHARPADLTVVAFGRLSVLTERAMARLAEEEIYVDAVFPLEVWPLDTTAILESVTRTSKLLVVEEGASGYDLGSEVIASVGAAHRGEHGLRTRRIGAHPVPIPNALELERTVLPSEQSIFAACAELFDE
jgi:2-oxoisovalerate dehydrogenase E1 component